MTTANGNGKPQEKLQSMLATYVGNLKATGGEWPDTRLVEAKELLFGWKDLVVNGLAYISSQETLRAQARANRLKIVRAFAALNAVDPELAEAYRAKHKIADREIEEAAAAAATATRTRTTRSTISGPGHVIIDVGAGRIAYRAKRQAFEVFRSYSRSQKTGHENNDKFDYPGFLRDVIGSDAIANGTTWTYDGKNWKYEYRPE